jgi:hypothetical protein
MYILEQPGFQQPFKVRFLSLTKYLAMPRLFVAMEARSSSPLTIQFVF